VAREVEEHRPYASTDTSLAKLQKNLANYNPSAETLAKILVVLKP